MTLSSCLDESLEVIDKMLAACSHLTLIEASKVTDSMLDLRKLTITMQKIEEELFAPMLDATPVLA